MNPRLPDYQSKKPYAAYHTDPANVFSPYAALREYQAVAWPPYSSTSFTPFQAPSLPVASSSRDQASESSLAAAFRGYQNPYLTANSTTYDSLASTIPGQPHQTQHIAEAPLAAIAPQLTLATTPSYTSTYPTYPTPVLPQQNETSTSRPAKRPREETGEDGQGLKPSTRKKRRAVSAKSRSHNLLADVADPQCSQHAAPPGVGHAARKRRPKERDARPPSPGIENIPFLNDSQDFYGYVQGGHTETHSRNRTIALAGSSGVCNAVEQAEIPNSSPPVGAGVAVPVPTGEHTWCTPAFYEELYKTASVLVAQTQALTSGASDGGAQYTPRIDEAPPQAISPSPVAPRYPASTKRTRAGSRQTQNSSHLADRDSGYTARKAQKKLLCPLADSSGVCHSKAELDSGSSEPRKTKASASKKRAIQEPQPPKLSTFGRQADLERHIFSVHLNVRLRCRRCYEANKCAQFARYDGFLRHLRTTCFGVKDSTISRRDAAQFGFISMPCYQHSDFARALSGLRKTQTALSLEASLREKYKHDNLDIRRCDCCRDLDDEEMDAIKPPSTAMGSSLTQPKTDGAFEVSDEDRLPPEAEEGVNEEPVSEPEHESNLHVGSASSAGYRSEMLSTGQEYPAPSLPGLSGLEEQESQENSVHHGVVPAAHHGTVQGTEPHNTSQEPTVLNLDELLADFGLEALASDPTWSIAS
ncbi:hypothetical protein GSI_03828 [Ganoderma sinense ZZ0214-1]|uniref:Uncharacterized protein n=1 Tax=Ganoderma sinense ZZ0214-1 TaxID=1077348 RepID=A0A2G8SK44_9APHY|nr:hypothetical protein GSI_03828 [Ganoderma sinense ZZ0214-1]